MKVHDSTQSHLSAPAVEFEVWEVRGVRVDIDQQLNSLKAPTVLKELGQEDVKCYPHARAGDLSVPGIKNTKFHLLMQRALKYITNINNIFSKF